MGRMSAIKKSDIYDSSLQNSSTLSMLNGLFLHRELLAILVSKDISTRYRRSILGLLWSLINPILSSLVLWVVFVSVFKPSLSNGTQFAPYLLAGVLVITFFNQSLMQGAEAISNGSEIFLKIRVDPLLFVFSRILTNSVNFFFGLIALTMVSFLSGASISAEFPVAFLLALLLIAFTTGFAMICSILFIRFDDTKYIVAIFLQLLTYITPVFYPKEVLGQKAQYLISLNPLTSFLDVFRHTFNGTEVATTFDWIYIFLSASLTFVIGIHFFQKYWAKAVVMM